MFTKIPFPAITIKSPDDLNQWAFPQRALDILAYDCVSNTSPCNETDILRNDFKFLTTEILNIIQMQLEAHAWDLNITTLKDWKEYPVLHEYSSKINTFDDLKTVAESLAMVTLQNESIGENMESELWTNFVSKFATFDTRGVIS